MADEEIWTPAVKRIGGSKFFAGGISKEDEPELDEFKYNCSRKNINMSYNGENRNCGWTIIFRRNNYIEDKLIPIASACGSNPDTFIDELITEFIDNVVIEFKKCGIVKEMKSAQKESIGKTVSKVTEKLQTIAMSRQ